MTPSAVELMESHLDEYFVHSTKFLGYKIERISHASTNSSGYDGEGNANEFRALGLRQAFGLVPVSDFLTIFAYRNR